MALFVTQSGQRIEISEKLVEEWVTMGLLRFTDYLAKHAAFGEYLAQRDRVDGRECP